MAKSAIELVRELAADVRVLGSETVLLRVQLADLNDQDRRRQDDITQLRKELAELRQENALLRQRIDESQKRSEEWGRRWWMLVPVLVGAPLALASGLIVTFAVKK